MAYRDKRIMSLIPELLQMIESDDLNANAAEHFADFSATAQLGIVQLVQAKLEEGKKLSREEAIEIKSQHNTQLEEANAAKTKAEEKKLSSRGRPKNNMRMSPTSISC